MQLLSLGHPVAEILRRYLYLWLLSDLLGSSYRLLNLLDNFLRSFIQIFFHCIIILLKLIRFSLPILGLFLGLINLLNQLKIFGDTGLIVGIILCLGDSLLNFLYVWSTSNSILYDLIVHSQAGVLPLSLLQDRV